TLIENQKALEQLATELEKSKNRFSMAVDGTKAGIYEWNILTNQLYVSARFKFLLGMDTMDDSTLNIETFRFLIHPEDRNMAISLVNTAVELDTTYQHEIRLLQNTGSYRWFLDSGIVSLKGSAPQLAVGSIIDIHDRKSAEQQLKDKNVELEKANRELDRFVYSASHDMRAPLTTLLGLIHLAQITYIPGELDTYHTMMIDRIHAMDRFIKEVTDYSRNSRLEVKTERINLRTTTDEVISALSFLANEAGVEIKIEIDISLELNSDKSRLKVILNNLIANAIKYTDSSKPRRFLKIQAKPQEPYCILRIVDNGIGIQDQYKDKIFDMFFRATEKSDGSGLGLYIAKETIQRLQGKITCQSEEGIGSTFEILLPIDSTKN
ncbi:MAG: PAS domain-containing protein, partial [Bacteroidia bacterium]|nr:PAS domain-containing protein [Bacteroidia bacterium]